MYERGSNQWHDLSYGSGASYPNGSSNGSYNGAANGSNGSGPEHVWYRSPAGEDTTAQTPAYPPAPAYPLSTPAYDSYATAPAQPVYSAYEAQYAPGATQSFPTQATPAASAAEVVDVTTYDPVTGLPMADGAVVYPMRNVAGRMAMVLGVFAILFTSVLFPLFPLAFFFAFGAIMLGRKGRLRARYGFASNPGSAGGGFALGVIAMVLAVIWTAAAALLFTSYSATDMKNCIQDTHNGPEAIHCIADVVDAG
jgi:hypothetical protein